MRSNRKEAMGLFLALDVGGTKTEYLLADESRELARARTGSIKRMRTDALTAAVHLEAGLGELAAKTGVRLETIHRTCVGTAGNTVPLVTDWLNAELRARVGGDLLIVGDVEIALDAAFPGKPGILVLAGTGSNVAGRHEDGYIFTTGGWGPALSDDGSGFRIGQQAIRAMAKAHDADRSTTLTGGVLDFWDLRSFQELVAYVHTLPAPDVSQLAGIVVRCATEGDALAQEVLQKQGEGLGELVLLLIARLRKHSTQPQALPPIAFAGSIMESVPRVRQALLSRVRQQYPAIKERQGVVDPLLGALWRARTTNRSMDSQHEE